MKFYRYIFILIAVLIILNLLVFRIKVNNYDERMELIAEYNINLSNGDVLVICPNGTYEKVTTNDLFGCGTIPNPNFVFNLSDVIS